MVHVTTSSGKAVTAADIAMFDSKWMHPDDRGVAFDRAYGNLYERSEVIAWEVSDGMTAMARMYELTRDGRYLADMKRFIDGAVLKFRDDHHPGPIHGGDAPAQPRDEFRDRVVPAWGGKGAGRGGMHGVDEVVSSAYAYPIAAFARIVAEEPGLQATYGDDAVRYANEVLQTVWAFMPQIRYRDAGDFVEAYLTHLAIYEFKPTAAACKAAYDQAMAANPTDGDNEQRRRNCDTLRKVFSRPMSHNENLAFAMVLIELWRTLESPFYRNSAARALEAEPARAMIPLLVSRQQRYFVNHLRTIEDVPGRPRFLWNHADDLPDSVDSRAEDAGHAALTMRYLELLRRNLDRLNVVAASVGEPIPLDDSHLRRFANTFLEKLVTLKNFGTGTNFADNVAGSEPHPDHNEPDAWTHLAVADVNVYQVCHNISLRAVSGKQPYLSIGGHASLLAHKQFAGRYQHVERTLPFGAPKAVGAPSGIVFPALGVANVVYRDAQGRLHELSQKGTEFGTSNLSDLAGNAMRAAGDPRSYIATTDGLLVALYRGTDGHVHSLHWSTGPVGRDALSGAAGAPPAAGNPIGFVQSDGTNVVVYRSGNRHLHSLWWRGTDRPGTEDLTAPSGAVAAGGDPSPYVNTRSGENIVIYRGIDGHIHSMYWTTGAVGHADLSGFARSPRAAGDPVAYYTAHNDSHQVTYRSPDGHLHELWWAGNSAVAHWDLTAAAAGAPPAASDAAAYYSAGTNTKHVIYRSANGHLNEIWWVPGGGIPAHLDITLQALAPSAADKPAAFTVEGPNSQHVVYRGTDGQIHEIRWT